MNAKGNEPGDFSTYEGFARQVLDKIEPALEAIAELRGAPLSEDTAQDWHSTLVAASLAIGNLLGSIEVAQNRLPSSEATAKQVHDLQNNLQYLDRLIAEVRAADPQDRSKFVPALASLSLGLKGALASVERTLESRGIRLRPEPFRKSVEQFAEVGDGEQGDREVAK